MSKTVRPSVNGDVSHTTDEDSHELHRKPVKQQGLPASSKINKRVSNDMGQRNTHRRITDRTLGERQSPDHVSKVGHEVLGLEESASNGSVFRTIGRQRYKQ